MADSENSQKSGIRSQGSEASGRRPWIGAAPRPLSPAQSSSITVSRTTSSMVVSSLKIAFRPDGRRDVPRQRRLLGDLRRLQVANLPHQDLVGVPRRRDRMPRKASGPPAVAHLEPGLDLESMIFLALALAFTA